MCDSGTRRSNKEGNFIKKYFNLWHSLPSAGAQVFLCKYSGESGAIMSTLTLKKEGEKSKTNKSIQSVGERG